VSYTEDSRNSIKMVSGMVAENVGYAVDAVGDYLDSKYKLISK